IPNLQFLKVTLHTQEGLSGVGASFNIERPAGLSDMLWELISSHYLKLKLIDRYNEQGNDEIAEIIADCGEFINSGGDDVRRFLSGRALDRTTVYGKNNWIATLMDAMATHPDLEKWIR